MLRTVLMTAPVEQFLTVTLTSQVPTMLCASWANAVCEAIKATPSKLSAILRQPCCWLTLRPSASHVQAIGGSNSTVPEARILYRALLVAKVRIDQPIALGITLRPLEVVEKCPGMKGANPSSIGDRASQFSEHFAVPLDSAPIWYATMFFFVGGIEVSASALGDIDDRVVVF